VWEADENPGANIALFTFGSYTNPRRSEPSYAFVNTVLRIRKYHRASFDVYYFRSKKNDWYFSGIDGCDSLSASLEEVERLAQRYERTMFLGNSMGGYAAILFGLPAVANAVLAFSPQTRFDLAFCADIRESRWREAYDAMRSNYDVDAMALRNRWPGLFSGDVEIHFGAKCAADERYAAQLDGLSGATPVGHEGCSHDLVHDLRASGKLEQIIYDKILQLQSH